MNHQVKGHEDDRNLRAYLIGHLLAPNALPERGERKGVGGDRRFRFCRVGEVPAKDFSV